MDKEEEYRKLCKDAFDAFDKSKEYERLAKKSFDLYIKLTNEAISMICPFGIGDIIEVVEPFGYQGKKRTMRMKVQRFMFYVDGYSVHGRQINKAGQVSFSKSITITGEDVKNPPVKIISKTEEV